MRCLKCETQLEDDAKFCPQCGTQVDHDKAGKSKPTVVANDSVIKHIDQSTHNTEGDGAKVAGSITIEADKKRIETCPICGKHNEIVNTFDCRECKNKYICLTHQKKTADGRVVCEDCFKKDEARRAEEARLTVKRAEEARGPSLMSVWFKNFLT
jgi:predicted RNA-binding Zn-ribbon protein involved in translation (DUF1610 family)